MDKKEFFKYYNDLNIKNNAGEFDDNYITIDYHRTKGDRFFNAIDFLAEFIKVFPKGELGDVCVNESIGFIHNEIDMYINKEFLVFCIDKKIFGEKAEEFYYKNFYDIYDLSEEDRKKWSYQKTYQKHYTT